jgi:hypothetical protein
MLKKLRKLQNQALRMKKFITFVQTIKFLKIYNKALNARVKERAVAMRRAFTTMCFCKKLNRRIARLGPTMTER